MLIFDLDGTLIDSRRDIATACNHALEFVGRPKRDEDEIGSYVGDGARILIERAIGKGRDKETVDRALEEFRAYYLANPVVHTTLMPGARECLELDRTLAIATNKQRNIAEAILDALGIRTRFSYVWGGGDGPQKPNPACVKMLLRESKADKRSTFMIGDGIQDIGAGKRAGVQTVAVLGGFHDEPALRALSPDFLIESLRELPSILTGEAAAPRSP